MALKINSAKSMAKNNKTFQQTNTVQQPGKKKIAFSFKSNIKYAENILDHLHAPLNIYDHRSNKFVYVNKLFAQLIGLSVEECYAQELKDYNNWINSDDLWMLRNLVAKHLINVLDEHIRDHSEQFNYVVNFRLLQKAKNLDVISVLANCNVLEWNANLTPAVTLNMFTLTTHYNHHQKMIFTANLLNKKTLHWTNVLKEEFLHIPHMLGMREREIMTSMLKEKSATEIAMEKKMSVHTVRSHWRNVLLKTNCKTQKELTHLAHVEGWI